MGFVNENHWDPELNGLMVAFDHEHNIGLEKTQQSFPGTIYGILKLHWDGQVILINADLFVLPRINKPALPFPKQDFLWRIKAIKIPQELNQIRNKIHDVLIEALKCFGSDGNPTRFNEVEVEFDANAFDSKFVE